MSGKKTSDKAVEEAIQAFWGGRDAQAEKQRLVGKLDAGLRGAVTGGGHLNGIRNVLAELFLAQGFPASSIRKSQGIVLPGYYRPTKKWDLLVVQDGVLVAAIELKSQVGPSFGNNFNNRTEEAIGNAVDIWRAYEEGTFGNVRPWLGYVFVLEEAAGSTSAVKLDTAVFPIERIFVGTSYKDRYRILCDRLVKERLYDAAWFLTSTKAAMMDEPADGLSFATFSAAITGRIAYIRAMKR
jgi:type II restriction enzyme